MKRRGGREKRGGYRGEKRDGMRQECTCCSLLQNLSDFTGIERRGTVPKSPSPTPNTLWKASMTLGQKLPDGLVPGLLKVPYLYPV